MIYKQSDFIDHNLNVEFRINDSLRELSFPRNFSFIIRKNKFFSFPFQAINDDYYLKKIEKKTNEQIMEELDDPYSTYKTTYTDKRMNDFND